MEDVPLPNFDVPTSAVTFVETEHGRLRRQQRGIDKKDLQRAKKYGSRRSTHPRPNGDLSAIYTYKDIVYIVNEVTGEEITSYAVPLKLESVPLTDQMREQAAEAQERTQKDLSSWTSNTVIVIDSSGSMKTGDVWGTRSRLGAVWVSVALDYIADRLESGEGCSTDVVSIVMLGSEPRTVIREQPCTWLLFNKVVEIYNLEKVQPRGHGPFLPSLEMAKKLLTRNSNEACAMALIFLSDGRPSDHIDLAGYDKEDSTCLIVRKVKKLAENFGRRLTFTAIGIGDYDNFVVLEQMVDTAKDYGAIAEFRLPSMTSSSLGSVFTSVASSVSTTKSEMTDVLTMKQQKVRDVIRESRTEANRCISSVSGNDFSIYSRAEVKRTVYEERLVDGVRKKFFDEFPLQNPGAGYVAFCKRPFGEGAERFAYRFFELAKDGTTIVGRPLVAKESRLVLEGDEEERKRFVRSFCSSQQLARRLAREFNDKLSKTRRAHPKTPRVSFLDCSIYQLNDSSLGKQSVLVEEKLDHLKWTKWNSNNGYVEGMEKTPTFTHDTLREAFSHLAKIDMGIIEECSDEEDDEDTQPILFTASQVAQAFSHFTYYATGRRRLVCDLQGVYDKEENVLKLSDPVIHYDNPVRSDRRVHGRTDRGRKGMAMFHATHKPHCSHLCKLMIRGFRRSHRRPTKNSS